MDRPEHPDVTSLMELAQSDLQEEDGNADEEEGNHVRDEEGTASIVRGELWKPPNVAKSEGGGG